MCLTYIADLRYLPRHVIRQGRFIEKTLFMQIIDSTKGTDVRSISIRSEEIPHIYRLRIQRSERSQEDLA